jgi:ATP-binding cassette, subfamily C (CFTR/MRP), member 1
MALSTGFSWYRSYRSVTMMRALLTTAIYTKTTEISTMALDNSTATTLMSVDVDEIVKSLRQLHELWASVIQIAFVYLAA